MSPEVVTIGMIVAAALLIAMDVLLCLDGRKGNTYSEILRAAGEKWTPLIMLIVFGMGLLAGHWWWSTPCPEVPCT